MVRILNFGSCNIDTVYTLDHIVSRGETQSSSQLTSYPGGKGLNHSVAAAKAGATVYHAGLVGEDGGILKDIMRENGVDVSFVKTVSEKSGHAIIQVTPEGDNGIFIYSGANRMFAKEYIDFVLSRFTENDMLLLQNEINLVGYIVERAHAIGMKIAFNPSPISKELEEVDFNKLTYLILNRLEVKAITGTDDPEAAIMYLLSTYPQLKIMLTMGKNGCVYAEGAKRIYHPAFKVEAVDITAAGTAFAGYFLASVANGEITHEAIRFASAAAAISVSRMGAAPSIPDKKEVEAALQTLKLDKSSSESENQINLITGYIETHILDAKLEELATLLGYSSVYTSTLIRKLTGRTFSEILQEKRCTVSARLLTETNMPISEIIYSVGYENESFFRRIFQKRYGQSPLKYRKRTQ